MASGPIIPLLGAMPLLITLWRSGNLIDWEELTFFMTSSSYVHPKDCPDYRAADADRKQHEAQRLKRQERRQALARAEWLAWYPSPPNKLTSSRV